MQESVLKSVDQLHTLMAGAQPTGKGIENTLQPVLAHPGRPRSALGNLNRVNRILTYYFDIRHVPLEIRGEKLNYSNMDYILVDFHE